ncbi:MAG: ATP-binding cassette domain-containing protein, partial [Promethearchaeota archaeon]
MSWFRIENLSVKVGDRLVLNDFSLNINKGEVHVLLGPNGAGKTTLIKTILGFKNYNVIHGKIIFKETDITEMRTDERIKLGIGVLFQHPPEINGVKLNKLLSVCSNAKNKHLNGSKIPLEQEELSNGLMDLSKRLNFSEEYLNRDVNVGFSGGEVKRSEILQMMVLKP